MQMALVALSLATGSGATAAEPAYRLAEGDQLRLLVPGATQFAGLYRLGASGRIALPLDAPIELGGMTLDEATVAIRAALSTEVQQPAVGVEIAERRPFSSWGTSPIRDPTRPSRG
jgi:protein involved in polysaccharide export with SLBB domain